MFGLGLAHRKLEAHLLLKPRWGLRLAQEWMMQQFFRDYLVRKSLVQKCSVRESPVREQLVKRHLCLPAL